MQIYRFLELRQNGVNFFGWIRNSESSDFLLLCQHNSPDPQHLSSNASIHDAIDLWKTGETKYLLFFDEAASESIKSQFEKEGFLSEFFDSLGGSKIASRINSDFSDLDGYRTWTSGIEPKNLICGSNITIYGFPRFDELTFNVEEESSNLVLASNNDDYRFHIGIGKGLLPDGEKLDFKKCNIEINFDRNIDFRVGAICFKLCVSEFLKFASGFIYIPLYFPEFDDFTSDFDLEAGLFKVFGSSESNSESIV